MPHKFVAPFPSHVFKNCYFMKWSVIKEKKPLRLFFHTSNDLRLRAQTQPNKRCHVINPLVVQLSNHNICWGKVYYCTSKDVFWKYDSVI